MPKTRPSSRTAVRLVRVSEPLEDAPGPEAFLAAGAGEPRGYWGGPDGSWVAHRGALVTLRVDGSPDEPGSPEDRFSAVAGEALQVRVAGDAGPAPRFHGGFSFRADHRAGGVWSAFPSARFVLPAAELVRTGTETVLTVQALAPEGAAPGTVRRALEERLAELRDGIRTWPSPGAFDAGAADFAQGAPRLDASAGETFVPSSRETFEDGVRTILDALQEGRLRKAVLARALDLSLAAPMDPVRILARLRRQNASAHVFLLEPEAGCVLAGAAPEVVASLRDGVFSATAVAGSIARGRTPAEDIALGERLLASVKDREEQELTLREMIRILESRVEGVAEVDPTPSLLTLPRIQHLESRIGGRAGSDETVLSLLSALHPTPAVCGLPREAALALLEEVEPVQRGWYAGPVGWFDASGEGEFVPALRSAVGGGTQWRLLAGAGIVAGSAPAAEWEETIMKLQPALWAVVGGSTP